MADQVESRRNPYRKAIREFRPTLFFVGLLSALINVLMLTGPMYMVQVYDRVLPSGSITTLAQLFLLVVALFICMGVYELMRARILSRGSFRFDETLREKISDYWLHCATGEGHLPNNPLRDLEIIRSFASGPAILGIFDLPWIPIFLAAVFWIHPWLGVLTVLGALIVIGAAVLNRILVRTPIADAAAADDTERYFLQKVWRNADMVLGMGTKQNVIRHWAGLRAAGLAKLQSGTETSERFTAFSKAFRLLLQSALLTVGAYLAIMQEISLGTIIAASILAGRALAPVDQVIGQWRAIGRATAAHIRLCDLLDGYADHSVTKDQELNKSGVTVTNLIKLAPGAESRLAQPRILDQVSFSLDAGDGLVVIGKSGAGKTSLAKMLVGVWQPDEGAVLLDGTGIGNWWAHDQRRRIGYLPQNVEMLPGTVAQNISGFEPAANEKDIEDAARLAGVHELIMKMADGYATEIGSLSQPLSGGQVQGLGLARAVFGLPDLVVLDEPNSNLDDEGNDALVAAIRALRARGSVVVIMAHRQNVIEAANKALLLQKGQMVQMGGKIRVLGGKSFPRKIRGGTDDTSLNPASPHHIRSAESGHQ